MRMNVKSAMFVLFVVCRRSKELHEHTKNVIYEISVVKNVSA